MASFLWFYGKWRGLAGFPSLGDKNRRKWLQMGAAQEWVWRVQVVTLLKTSTKCWRPATLKSQAHGGEAALDSAQGCRLSPLLAHCMGGPRGAAVPACVAVAASGGMHM